MAPSLRTYVCPSVVCFVKIAFQLTASAFSFSLQLMVKTTTRPPPSKKRKGEGKAAGSRGLKGIKARKWRSGGIKLGVIIKWELVRVNLFNSQPPITLGRRL